MFVVLSIKGVDQHIIKHIKILHLMYPYFVKYYTFVMLAKSEG